MGTIISVLFKILALGLKAFLYILLLPVKLIALPLKAISLLKWAIPLAAGVAIFKALERRGQAVEGSAPAALT